MTDWTEEHIWPSDVDDENQWKKVWERVGVKNSYFLLLREAHRRGLIRIISWDGGENGLPKYEWLCKKKD